MHRHALGITALALASVACGKVDRADNRRIGTPGDSTVGAGGVAGATSGVTDTTATRGCATDNGGLTLAGGLCAGIFADSIMHARHVAVAPNGDVYITLEGTNPSPEKTLPGERSGPPPASFVALRDTNRDGKADVIKRIGTLGNTGVTARARPSRAQHRDLATRRSLRQRGIGDEQLSGKGSSHGQSRPPALPRAQDARRDLALRREPHRPALFTG
jgi:hypothetical protein